MSLRRWSVAAAVMLTVLYLRFTMPVFGECVIPALQEMLREEQIGQVMPDAAETWPDSD